MSNTTIALSGWGVPLTARVLALAVSFVCAQSLLKATPVSSSVTATALTWTAYNYNPFDKGSWSIQTSSWNASNPPAGTLSASALSTTSSGPVTETLNSTVTASYSADGSSGTVHFAEHDNTNFPNWTAGNFAGIDSNLSGNAWSYTFVADQTGAIDVNS